MPHLLCSTIVTAPPRLVLASASPARRATLRAAGIDPLVRVSSVDEDAVVAQASTRHPGLTPADVALLLARAKAEDVAAALRADPGRSSGGEATQTAVAVEDRPGPDSFIILGCDSVLELDGEVHGKPADPAEAVARWRRMRARSGVLHTGHWLLDERPALAGGTGGALGVTASTRVHFARVSDAEIEAYVATGEPLRVAGAFTIDGLGGAFVTGIEGDHHNVVGLSLPVLRELLLEIGVAWFDLVRAPHGSAA